MARRSSLLLALTLILATVVAAPAIASPPTNDLSGGAAVIDPTGLPFNDVLSTVEATTDGEDNQANEQCGFGATEASVWYRFTPDTDGEYVLDTSASDYSAGLILATGSPGSLDAVSCGAGPFFASMGVEYWILVFDSTGGDGGTLSLTLDAAPPPPEISVSIGGGEFDNKTGGAIVYGTFTCTSDTYVERAIYGTLTQSVGRFTIQGSFGFDSAGECAGSPLPWIAEVFPTTGKFKGGWATVDLDALACEVFGVCGSASAEKRIKLGRG